MNGPWLGRRPAAAIWDYSRPLRRLDALFPHYGFRSHVGYITPGHSAVVRERGPSAVHRLSFQALCYLTPEEALARAGAQE